MKYIDLSPYTKGKQAMIDDDDYIMVSQWKWKFDKHTGYAVRNASYNGRAFVMYMHRLINNTPKGKITDHIDRNKLNNTKENLRTTDKSGNAYNSSRVYFPKSGFGNVYYKKNRKNWEARVQVNKKPFTIGYYDTPELAHQAVVDFQN